MATGRKFAGKRLPLMLAFGVLVAAAIGAGCRGFFVKPTLTSIAVGPGSPTIQTGNTGNTVQMFAVGTFNDGSTGNPQVTWSSGTTSVATINASGLVTAVDVGTSTITATAVQNPSITGTQTVSVTVGCISSIDVEPKGPIDFSNGGLTSQQFKATANTCNGSFDITSVATWTSNNTTVVTVIAGLAEATGNTGADGDVTITASSGGVVSNQVTIHVSGF